MSKKIIYIAHPIGGNVAENVKKIQAIYRELSLQGEVIPFAPYLAAIGSLDDSNPKERAMGMEHNHYLIKSGIVDEIWLYGDRISEGMAGEIVCSFKTRTIVVSKSKDIEYEK